MRSITRLFGVSVIAMASVARAAPIVQNGGFESGPISLDVYVTPFQSLVIPDWTAGAMGNGPTFLNALRSYPGGHQGSATCLSMEGGWISQDITLPAGTTTVSFWAAGYSNLGPNPLTVTLGTTNLTFNTATSVTPASVDWVQYTTDAITVAAGTYTLKIDSTLDFQSGFSKLDDVSVSVPEPTLLGLVGVTSLLAFSRRREVR